MLGDGLAQLLQANVALGLSQADDERAHDVGTLRQLDDLTRRIRGLMSP